MARTYIAAIYDTETHDKLRQWCGQHGFDLGFGYSGEARDPNEYEFHTTIFHTVNDIADLKEGSKYRLIESHPVTPIGFTMLGMDKNIPVLKLELTGMIATLRQKYEGLGLRDQWEQYTPHISLSYAKTPMDLTDIPLPDFSIRFNHVKIEDITE